MGNQNSKNQTATLTEVPTITKEQAFAFLSTLTGSAALATLQADIEHAENIGKIQADFMALPDTMKSLMVNTLHSLAIAENALQAAEKAQSRVTVQGTARRSALSISETGSKQSRMLQAIMNGTVKTETDFILIASQNGHGVTYKAFRTFIKDNLHNLPNDESFLNFCR
jgi:hypothetical protein